MVNQKETPPAGARDAASGLKKVLERLSPMFTPHDRGRIVAAIDVLTGKADGAHVFNCRRCPVSVTSRWLEPTCPECGDPTEFDATAKPQPIELCELHGPQYVRGCAYCAGDLDTLEATQPAATGAGEAKDWPEDFAHENGNYENVCHQCERHFYGHKRRITCKECATTTATNTAATGMGGSSIPYGYTLFPTANLTRMAETLERDGDEHGVARDIRAMVAASPALAAQPAPVDPGTVAGASDSEHAEEVAMILASRGFHAAAATVRRLAAQPAPVVGGWIDPAQKLPPPGKHKIASDHVLVRKGDRVWMDVAYYNWKPAEHDFMQSQFGDFKPRFYGGVEQWMPMEVALALLAARPGGDDTKRLDYIERTFAGCSNQERYLPLRMLWGKGANGRTLREACDKYMARDAAHPAQAGGESS